MFDAGTVDPDEGLRPIGALRATARPEGEVESKYNYAARRFAQQPVLFHTWGTTRGYGERYYCWDALALCHGPLYFQDLNAERYGYHYGCCQSVYSGIMFFARCGLLPYSVLAECPCECVYTLGYDRPGNCVPLRWYCLPCPSWRHHCVEDSMDVEEEFAE
jgi:hypothetical protein